MKRLGPTQPLLPCGPFPFLSPAQNRSPVSFGPVPPRRPSPLLPPSASPLGPTARARSLQPRHARAFSRWQASPTGQRLLAPAPRARPLPRLAGELTPPARPIFPGAPALNDPGISGRESRRDPYPGRGREIYGAPPLNPHDPPVTLPSSSAPPPTLAHHHSTPPHRARAPPSRPRRPAAPPPLPSSSRAPPRAQASPRARLPRPDPRPRLNLAEIRRR